MGYERDSKQALKNSAAKKGFFTPAVRAAFAAESFLTGSENTGRRVLRTFSQKPNFVVAQTNDFLYNMV